MSEIQSTDLRDALDAALPEGYVLSRDVVFPDKDIPITAVINGRKVTIGSGRINPETGVFNGTIDDEPNGEIIKGQLRDQGVEFSYNPFLNVSELELSRVQQIVDAKIQSVNLVSETPDPRFGVFPIESIKVEPNGHAYVEQKLDREEEEPDGPTPRFHDHD